MNPNNKNQSVKFAFFGSSKLSTIVLDELKKSSLSPQFIVTTPDKPVGRKQLMTPNIVKSWAIDNNINFYDPQKLNPETVEKIRLMNTNEDGSEKCSVFLVASYGKIIPKSLLDIPSRKTLNIHPSLLPKYRGASPLPTAIVEDTKKTGITIMELDPEMDHGPIIIQKEITITEWPTYEVFEEMMARKGALLFAEILKPWNRGEIQAKEQDHTQASYTKKITKEDGKIDLGADPYLNFRKIQAYHEWPQAYFFINHNNKDIRIKITEASFEDGKLIIQKVIPEGSKEISFADFKRGYKLI